MKQHEVQSRLFSISYQTGDCDLGASGGGVFVRRFFGFWFLVFGSEKGIRPSLLPRHPRVPPPVHYRALGIKSRPSFHLIPRRSAHYVSASKGKVRTQDRSGRATWAMSVQTVS